MKNIGILVPVLLAFLLNVEALDFSSCDDSLRPRDREACISEVCGYGGPRYSSDCLYLDFLHYGAVACKALISIMVFISLLIIVVIIEKV